jgi:hypothetical protein
MSLLEKGYNVIHPEYQYSKNTIREESTPLPQFIYMSMTWKSDREKRSLEIQVCELKSLVGDLIELLYSHHQISEDQIRTICNRQDIKIEQEA